MQSGDLREIDNALSISQTSKTKHLKLAGIQGYENLKDAPLRVPVTYTAADDLSSGTLAVPTPKARRAYQSDSGIWEADGFTTKGITHVAETLGNHSSGQPATPFFTILV